MKHDIVFSLGDLVYYIGPPILSPLRWDLIVENNNGIINTDDIGIIIKINSFLRIADVFFHHNEIIIERLTFSRLKSVE